MVIQVPDDEGRTESVKVGNHMGSNTEARSVMRMTSGLRFGWISRC